MRVIILTAGGLIGGGFVFLGCLVLVMGEALVPTQGADFHAFGLPAYAMGVGWLGLGVSLFCVGLLGAKVGPQPHVRVARDAGLFVFGAGLVAALVLAILKVHGNVAL